MQRPEASSITETSQPLCNIFYRSFIAIMFWWSADSIQCTLITSTGLFAGPGVWIPCREQLVLTLSANIFYPGMNATKTRKEIGVVSIPVASIIPHNLNGVASQIVIVVYTIDLDGVSTHKLASSTWWWWPFDNRLFAYEQYQIRFQMLVLVLASRKVQCTLDIFNAVPKLEHVIWLEKRN